MVPAGFPLTRDRAREILAALPDRRIAVLGDFHLDVYWHANMRVARLSRETPHFARPVYKERYDPGVGGVIAANLRALGVGAVIAVGACGDDWRGEVLRGRLEELGVSLEAFRVVRGRVTPTYIKPMLEGYESIQEDPRLDFQDTRHLPQDDEAELIGRFLDLAPTLDGVAVIDQIEDETGGIVTESVRAALDRLGRSTLELPISADSRSKIERFRGVLVKVNRLELSRAVKREVARSSEELLDQARALSRRTGRTVFVSDGPDGMAYVRGRRAPGESGHVPAIPVEGPIDPVGAGDSASAGLVGALSAGASIPEAVAFANIVASITVGKLGVTGTASPEEVLAVFG